MITRKKILLIDDDLSSLKSLELSLSNQYDLSTARNGLAALNHISQQHIDLIVLDLKIPVIDGQSLVQVLYKNEQWKKIPIVIITGYGNPSLSLPENVKAFLGKPVKKEDLDYEISRNLTG